MSILEVADRITSSDRQADYGHPLDDFQGSADILRVLVRRRYGVDIKFTPDFIGLLMAIAIKGNRQAGKHKEDNLIDICGYTRTVEMCHDEIARREQSEHRNTADAAGTLHYYKPGEQPVQPASTIPRATVEERPSAVHGRSDFAKADCS